MNEFVISDLHLFHKNIIKYCQRPFNNIDEMHEELIKRWNSVVKDDDIVYVLGDLIFGKDYSILDRFNGHIILIRGNHDSNNLLKHSRFQKVYKKYLILERNDKKILLIHKPVCYDKHIQLKPQEEYDICFHGHIHNSSYPPVENYYNVSVEVIDYTPLLLEV